MFLLVSYKRFDLPFHILTCTLTKQIFMFHCTFDLDFSVIIHFLWIHIFWQLEMLQYSSLSSLQKITINASLNQVGCTVHMYVNNPGSNTKIQISLLEFMMNCMSTFPFQKFVHTAIIHACNSIFMHVHCTNKMSIDLPLFPPFSCCPAGSEEVHGCPAAESLEIFEL